MIYANRRIWLLVFAAATVVAAPTALPSYFVHVLVFISIYATLTLGLTLLYGHSGMLSLAHAAFFGIGAYASAVAELRYGLPVIGGLVIAVAAPAVIAFLIGRPLARLRHLSLAIGTLAFSEIVNIVFRQGQGVTGGQAGLGPIPALSLGGLLVKSPERFYYVAVGFLVVTMVLCMNMLNGRVGRALRSIRDNETAGSVMGVNLVEYKVYVLTFASACAGLGGWLYAHYVGYISPDLFTTHFSIALFLVVFVGGVRSLWGSLLGAVFLILIPEYLSRLGRLDYVAYGVLIVLVLMFSPQGLVGILQVLLGETRRLVKHIPTSAD